MASYGFIWHEPAASPTSILSTVREGTMIWKEGNKRERRNIRISQWNLLDQAVWRTAEFNTDRLDVAGKKAGAGFLLALGCQHCMVVRGYRGGQMRRRAQGPTDIEVSIAQRLQDVVHGAHVEDEAQLRDAHGDKAEQEDGAEQAVHE